MQIKKIAVQMTKMTNEQLKEEIFNINGNLSIVPLLNEAYKRLYIDPFVNISNDHTFINNPDILKLTLNIISQKVKDKEKESVLIIENILNLVKNIDNKTINSLLSLSLSSPKITSAILLHENTPKELTQQIIKNHHLNIVRNDNRNQSIFNAIIQDLKTGKSWDNEYSGLLLLVRLNQNTYDAFMTTISQFNLHPSICNALINASEIFKLQNKQLKENVDINNSAPMQLIKAVNTNRLNNMSGKQGITFLTESILKGNNITITKWIWNLLKEKMEEDESWTIYAFKMHIENHNILNMIMNEIDILPDLINIIQKINNINAIKGDVYEEVIHRALNSSLHQDNILKLPQDAFSLIKMTPENRKTVNDHFNPEVPKGAEGIDLLDLLAKNKGWYKQAYISELMQKEAGTKTNVMSSLLAAIIAVLSGTSIYNASKQNNIPEQIIEKAMQDNEIITIAEEKMNEPKNINIDTLVNLIIRHEGLLPKQTPFRITNDDMKKWNTIHGYKIDKITPIPHDRRNFIFLENQEDVPKAVKQQLINYATKPGNYNLPPNPTLKDALFKFDQTGAKGKITFLINNIPNLNINKPLASFL